MIIYLNVLIFLLSLIDYLEANSLEHDGMVNIKLEHSLNYADEKPIFTERGNITIQSLRLGQTIKKQNPLTPEEQNQLRDLAANNLFYQVRATAVSSDGIETTFLSSAKACMLAEAGLDDILSVALDYTGRVIGVTIVIASTSTCEGAVVPVEELKFFNTEVFIKYSETGPIPDTATYIQKLDREREAKERGEVKDNRSFFAKYWMYIVPVVILMMVSSMANPEGAGGPAR